MSRLMPNCGFRRFGFGRAMWLKTAETHGHRVALPHVQRLERLLAGQLHGGTDAGFQRSLGNTAQRVTPRPGKHRRSSKSLTSGGSVGSLNVRKPGRENAKCNAG